MKKWIKVIFILFLIFISISAAGIFYFLKKTPSVSSNSILIVELNGNFEEGIPVSFPQNILYRGNPSLYNVLNGIKQAGKDKRISGMLLNIGSVELGLARCDEVRNALLEFRKSGKTLVSSLSFAGNKEYMIATAAPQIFIQPGGYLMVNGMKIEALFLKGLLDKVGIDPEFMHMGEYKSAQEMFTRSDMSEPFRENLTSILDDVFEYWVKIVSQARNYEDKEFELIIDKGPFVPSEAKEYGLVDGIKFTNDILVDTFGEKNPDKASLIELKDYLRAVESKFKINNGTKIALINAKGTIMPGQSQWSPTSGQTLGSESFSRILKQVRDDESIKAAILWVNSPGGSGTASDQIWNELCMLKNKKPLVVSVSDVAASGGYYISIPANRILATPLSLTGSIGVISGKFNARGLYDKLGITKEVISRGKNADLFSDYRPLSESESERMEKMISDFYDRFVELVASGRNKDKTEIEKIARGRIWTGNQGREIGLVDKIGGIFDAIDTAKELLNIKQQAQVEIVMFPRKKGFFEMLQDEDIFQTAGINHELIGYLGRLMLLEKLGESKPLLFAPMEVSIR